MTFSCTCAQTILYGVVCTFSSCKLPGHINELWLDFELTPLVLSSTFFEPKKKHSVSMDPKRPIYQCTARWTMQGLMKPVFDIVSCCTLQRQKVMRWVATVLLDKALFLKKLNGACKKENLHLVLEYIKKTVDLDYHLSLLVAQLVRFWFKSLQSLTAHERQFLQGNLFLLAVCTHKV